MMGMKKSRRVLVIAAAAVIALCAVVSVAGVAFASGGAAEGGGHLMEWVWKILNFAILVGILVYFARKPLAQFLRARTEAIQKSLDEARLARELAEKALKEVEERLRLKDKDIEEIVNASKASGEGERDALIKEAERMSQKIAEHARANIDYELKKAKDELKKEAVELALELAEKKLIDRLTPEEQLKLLEESISKLEGKS